MGRWDDGKGGLAHREGIREEHWSAEVGAARSATDLCSALPRIGRRVGADPISLGHVSVQTTERYLGCKQRIRSAVNDRIGIEPNP
jgi:hypothetical protein